MVKKLRDLKKDRRKTERGSFRFDKHDKKFLETFGMSKTKIFSLGVEEAKKIQKKEKRGGMVKGK